MTVLSWSDYQEALIPVGIVVGAPLAILVYDWLVLKLLNRGKKIDYSDFVEFDGAMQMVIVLASVAYGAWAYLTYSMETNYVKFAHLLHFSYRSDYSATALAQIITLALIGVIIAIPWLYCYVNKKDSKM